MEKTTHTPAWYFRGNVTNDQGYIADEHTGRSIAVIYTKANGPLIAAAPELLEALKLCQAAFRDLAEMAGDVTEWNCGGIGYQASQATNAAINKAEGRD